MIYIQERTELEAVNTMLRQIGESPVNSTGVEELAPGAIAFSLLTQISRSIQSKGWWFNTLEEYELVVNDEGNIQVPINTMNIKPSLYSFCSDTIVIRDNQLYNNTTHSYTFDSNITVDLVLALGFHDLPQTAREYITMAAAKRFTSSYTQSDLLFKFSDDEYRDAEAALWSDELVNRPTNMLNNGGRMAYSRRRVF